MVNSKTREKDFNMSPRWLQTFQMISACIGEHYRTGKLHLLLPTLTSLITLKLGGADSIRTTPLLFWSNQVSVKNIKSTLFSMIKLMQRPELAEPNV